MGLVRPAEKSKNEKRSINMRVALNRKDILNFFRKYHWITLFLILVLYITIMKMIPTVYATNLDELKARIDNLIEGFNRTNFEYMRQAYSSFKTFTTSDGSGVADMRNFLVIVADVMVVIFSLINISKETQRGEISMDYWFRIAAALVVAIVLVTSVGTVMDNLYGFGDYVISAAYNNMKDDSFEIDGEMTTTTGQKMSDDQKNNFLETLSYVPGLDGGEDGSGNIKELYETESDADASFFKIETASSVVTLMEYAVYAPLLVCMFLIFSAIFEVKVRQIFAPVAVAAIAYEGGRSTGVRFLKKYLACFVKIALYFTIAAIGAEMTAFFFARTTASAPNIEDGKLTVEAAINLVMMIGSNIVAAMSMMQIGGLGDEIVGV